MQRILFLTTALACFSLAAAQACRPDFNPAANKGPASGPPNEVMVLGTAHLRFLKAPRRWPARWSTGCPRGGRRPSPSRSCPAPSATRWDGDGLDDALTVYLRMASNIRKVLELTPGMKMLVVVSASHKAYLEAYLHQMRDVRLADAAPVLQ